ncbi:MAG: site-2 protease family protein [Phycisphaerales bacterium]|nr:site-2 protease family protein [Phycisphaerales bacterium]MCI0631592.1 site-2 protease family protein [Phycisphaerales bacterium]MCI0674161.1 site-2 protease family protein [Phycisphaerales bacterium]
MFGPRLKVMRLAGFDLYVDLSWFFIAVLVTWSLASGLFPRLYPELIDRPGVRWAMGVAGALGLFASIVLHELGHAIAARRFGLRMRGITLFIFGGVAELIDEPPDAKSEFVIAIAGPLVSVALGLLFLGIAWTGAAAGLTIPTYAVFNYLGAINLLLVAFNMIPAFPLDGGRVLRAALWAWRGNLRWATRITSKLGALFGIGFIVLGVWRVIAGDFIGGMWWVLIGMFLRQAAQLSYQQLLLRRALEGETVARFMRTDPVVVPPHTTVADLVDRYIYVHHHKLYPVASNGDLLGCVTTRKVKELPREEWGSHTVEELADRCAPENTVTPDTDAMDALAKMNRNGSSRLLVVDDQGHLVGILTLKDLMRFMSVKVELEE